MFKRFFPAAAVENSLLSAAKNGDAGAREKLIAQCQIFIEKNVALHTRTYQDVRSRDEYSIGLIAFNEAIDKYDPVYNRTFLSFAGEVIKMRIIDYQRSNRAGSNCLPFSSIEYSEEFSSGLAPAALDPVGEELEREDDLDSFRSALKEFGISLDDLVINTPKHRDSRLLSLKIARTIAGDPELLSYLRQKKAIPLKKLLGKIKVNPKTIDRHRKYIIAICLILDSNLKTLKGYVKQTGEGGGKDGL